MHHVAPFRISGNDDDPVWREQLDRLATSVRRWTGNHAGIAEISEIEIPRLRGAEPQIVAELKEDAVLLFGSGVSALLSPTQ